MNYREEYERWLNSDKLSQSEKDELRAIADNDKEIEDRFYQELEFGTAGLRGVMALGTARMNIHIIRHATQAFAETILEDGNFNGEPIAICHDCRINSRAFAEEAACVMASNGIHVRLFEDMRPTPELSFAVRHYSCSAGLNITASHNPKEYNGYKVYWSDGAQLPPQKADIIAEKMTQIDIFDGIKSISFKSAIDSGMITLMGSETDDAFLENVMSQANDFGTVNKVSDKFSMVYTPFHGTGYKMVPEVLHRLGIKKLHCVPEQMSVDGNFPTVVSPNPENPEGFYLAVELAEKVGSDFILGTDPDTDRVGLMVRDRYGKFIPLSGNQTGALMLDYLIGAKKRNGTMPDNPVALKTIVSSDLVRKIAESGGVRCINTFTGFKFMAEKKNSLEANDEGKVIFSYEEAYGYMLGDFVRDKDAVTASLILTEMAAWYYEKGMTLYDALMDLYKKHGTHAEKTVSLVMPGLDGVRKMSALMAKLRAEPPVSIAGHPVSVRFDYSTGEKLFVESGEAEKTELVGSNVLSFTLSDGTTVVVRPSGTEPKIKVYILAEGESQNACDEKLSALSEWANSLKEL